MNEQHATLNQPVRDFSIETTKGGRETLATYRGNNVVLFFYPKDNTPVCTSEAKAFRDHYQAFKDNKTLVLGVSRDSLSSHNRFKGRLELPFELIADTNEELCNYFDVIKLKNFFGKKVRGIVRSTFLIDKDGILRSEWRKITVTGHIDEVIAAINKLH